MFLELKKVISEISCQKCLLFVLFVGYFINMLQEFNVQKRLSNYEEINLQGTPVISFFFNLLCKLD